eukprot:8617053-Karenia_brevis.AAC.2
MTGGDEGRKVGKEEGRTGEGEEGEGWDNRGERGRGWKGQRAEEIGGVRAASKSGPDILSIYRKGGKKREDGGREREEGRRGKVAYGSYREGDIVVRILPRRVKERRTSRSSTQGYSKIINVVDN